MKLSIDKYYYFKEMRMMSELTHDPSEYIRGLQQLLVSDKKKIAFLFGAGTSCAKKNQDSIRIPAVAEMTKKVEEELSKTEFYKHAIEEIKLEIGENNYNIESLLSSIEQKQHIIGNGKLNGLTGPELETLVKELKDQIRKIVSVHDDICKDDNGLNNLIHVDFAEWVGRADRKHSIEIFTTNYDYLFELGMEEKNIPYYDGFTGSYKPFFNAESVEDLYFAPKVTKLWKLHGSLGWHYNKHNKKVWRKLTDSEDILIYPSTLKYVDSKKQPYTSLMDRLTNFLKEPDTILITCGYSFSDEHINERIITGLKSNSSSHVYALYYDICWEDKGKKYALTEESNIAKLAKSNRKISVYGCRNAIIGCQYGAWKLKREPDHEDKSNIMLYFDEDVAFNDNDSTDTVKLEDKPWTGEGELILPNFIKFVEFLKSMMHTCE